MDDQPFPGWIDQHILEFSERDLSTLRFWANEGRLCHKCGGLHYGNIVWWIKEWAKEGPLIPDAEVNDFKPRDLKEAMKPVDVPLIERIPKCNCADCDRCEPFRTALERLSDMDEDTPVTSREPIDMDWLREYQLRAGGKIPESVTEKPDKNLPEDSDSPHEN